MNQQPDFHGLDVVIVAAFAVGTLIGASRGVFRQTVRVVVSVAAFYLALTLHGPVEWFLRNHLTQVAPDVSRLHSLLATFLATYVVTLLGSRLIRKLLRSLHRSEKDEPIEALGLKPLDRLLGAGVGALTAGLLVGAALLGLGSISDPALQSRLAGSQLMPPMVQAMRQVLQGVPESCRDEFVQALRRLEDAARATAVDLTTEELRKATERINGLTEGAERAQGLNSQEAKQ
jgi:uncharacterized membrane protein required for colicin V production